MTCCHLLHCLSFCKRAVSVAILFSSLLCYAFDDSALGDAYTVTNSQTASVPPGKYSNIVVDYTPSSATTPAVNIHRAGEVILTGSTGAQLIAPLPSTALSSNPTHYPVRLNLPQSVLILQNGSMEGNIYLQKGTLVVGNGGAQENAGLEVSGRIDGGVHREEALANPSSTLKINGVDLVVKGAIGSTNYRVGLVEVEGASLKIQNNNNILYPSGNVTSSIAANAVSVKSDSGIEIARGADVTHLFLSENGEFIGSGEHGSGSAHRFEIRNVIDGGDSGALGAGSRLINEYDNIFLGGGVTKGAGEIGALNIAAFGGLEFNPAQEILAHSLIQDSGTLKLHATQDIVAGTIEADEIKADNSNIVAGSINPDTGNSGSPQRFYLAASQMNLGHNYFFPRAPITTNRIEAPAGGVYAGSLDITGAGGVLAAENLLLVKEDANGDMPVSSGDFNLKDGSFSLTGTPINESDSENRIIEYAAQIDGNMTVEKNSDSSFTTMNVAGAATITGGSLTGNSSGGQTGNAIFKADSATFKDIGTINIEGTLDIAKTLDISGETANAIDITTVGESAQISGGSYSGKSFSADSATFTDVSKIDLSDALTLKSGLTMTDSVANSIKSATITDGDATISGGSYTGGSLQAKDAEFTGVSGVTLADTLNLSGNLKLESTGLSSIANASITGDATISGGSYTGTKFEAGEADFSGMESVNLAGDFSAKGSATFADVNTLNISGEARTGGDFTQTGGQATLANLNVGRNLSVTSGYLKAKDASAIAAVFDKNTSAEFDTLTLNGSDLTLTIESGSTVFINNSLTSPSGYEGLDEGSKLIIRGLNDQPTTTKAFYIGKNTAAEYGNKNLIFNLTDGLFGGDNDGAPSSADFTSLSAGEIDVTNVNLILRGVGNFANQVDRNLIIHQNGASRLGDISVGGFVEIDRGTVAAGQMNVTGDASFDAVGLSLSGPGSVGGNLVLENNGQSSLGDISVTGNTDVSGGVLEAGQLETGSATLHGALQANIQSIVVASGSGSLDIGAQGEDASHVNVNSLDLHGAPLTVHGESVLQIFGETAEEAGAVNIPENGVISDFGDLTVKSAALGQEGAELAAANVTVREALTEMKGGAITATDSNVTLMGGAKDAVGAITANADIIAGSGDSPADISGQDLALEAGRNISAAVINVDSLKAGADINATDITAKTLVAGGNVTASAGSVNLTGEGSNIGGDLTISANEASSLGDLAIGGAASVTGGKLEAGKISAASAKLDGAIAANIGELVLNAPGGFVTVGADGESASSLAAGSISLNGGPLNVYGPSSVEVKAGEEANSGALSASEINIFQNGKVSADGDITADALRLGKDGAELAGANVTVSSPLTEMNGGAITATEGNVTLMGGASAASGSITANADILSRNADIGGEGLALDAGGNIFAAVINVNSLKAGADIDAADITAKTLAAGGNVTARAGSVNLAGAGNHVGGNLVAQHNVKSSLGSLEVAGKTRFANGELNATSLTTGSANLDNIRASFEELVLKNSAEGRGFSLASTGSDGSEATVGSINLNGGLLSLAANSAGPANLFIGKFSAQPNIINGNIAVNQNGLLVLGSQNADIMQTPDAISASGLATFALAQPMRLDSRFGIHVTGAGVASPAANSIRFDASSLFVIDSRMASAVYAYLGSPDSIFPSAQLSGTNGAIGALSADKASVPANVDTGAQIYIRNPQANTVIVALGENITTLYADKTGRAGDAGSAPWTGVNLDYDNKDKVKIQRLENQYAGQFLVLPVDSPDPGPDDPKPPVNPDPDKPNPPAPSEPDKPDNPNPSEPDTPDSPEPDNPDDPDPDKPDPDDPNPDEPDQPDTPEPPVTPVSPDPEPLRPGQQFIHDAHVAFPHDSGKAEQVIYSASHLATAGGVPHLVHAANDTASEVILRRARILDILAEGEELTGRSFALWALPLYKGISGRDLGAGSGEYGYAGGIGGVILGADLTFAQKFRAGLDFNIGGGYTKSSGDLSQTENNMSFWGLGAYAGYREGNLGLEAEFSFTSSYNKVRQETPADLHWGDLKSDILATAISAALRAEYRFETGFLDIVPHAGVRYLNLHALSYDINASGKGIIVEGSGFYQNIWTFPFGIYMGKTFELENGMKIMPSLDFTVVPATGDLDTKNRVRYTGEVQEIDLHTRFMDDTTYGGSAGIELKAGDFTIGVNYTGQFGKHTTSNGIFGLLRYEF